MDQRAQTGRRARSEDRAEAPDRGLWEPNVPAAPAWGASGQRIPGPQPPGHDHGPGHDPAPAAPGEPVTAAPVSPARPARPAGSPATGDVEPGRRVPLIGILVAVAVLAVVAAAFVALRGGGTDEAPAAPNTAIAVEPPPENASFRASDCGAWQPEDEEEAQGWLYRACIRAEAGRPGMWLVGAQVRNLGRIPKDVRVYLTYLSSTGGQQTPITLKQGTVGASDVDPDGVATLALGRMQHPGAEACAWTEVAPLFLTKREWSASRGVDDGGGRCTPVGSAAAG